MNRFDLYKEQELLERKQPPKVKFRSSIVRLDYYFSYTTSYNLGDTQRGAVAYTQGRASQSQPNWRKLVRAGQQAGTPFTANQVYRSKYESGFCQVRLTLGRGTASDPFVHVVERFQGAEGYTVNAPNHVASRSASTDNKANTSVRSAVRLQQEQFQGMTFLGELRETARLVRRPMASLLDSVQQYGRELTKTAHRVQNKKGADSKRKRKLFVDAASGLWLEASFGWKPLLSDVKGIAETVARAQYDFRHTEVRGYGKTTTVQELPAQSISRGYLRGAAMQRDTTDHIVVLRAGVSSSASSPAFGSAARLAELSGFNYRSFIPTLWNLAPWSFLVDYVTNVSDFLEGNLTDTSTVKWVNKSDILRTTRNVRTSGSAPSGVNVTNYVGGDNPFGMADIIRKDVIRSQSGSIPFVYLEPVTLPGSGTKYLNVLALAMQSVRKLPFQF